MFVYSREFCDALGIFEDFGFEEVTVSVGGLGVEFRSLGMEFEGRLVEFEGFFYLRSYQQLFKGFSRCWVHL